MNKEDFRILKEVCGLHQKADELSKAVDVEQSRISKIETLRIEANKDLADATQSLVENSKNLLNVENKTEDLNKKILQGEQALNNATSEKQLSSSQMQLNSFKSELDNFENEAFNLLEISEELQERIDEKNNFLNGSEKTLKDISIEVQQNIDPMMSEIEVIRKRIDNLGSQLPEQTKTRLYKLIDKKLMHGPLTKIQDGSCFICRYEVNSINRDKIDKNLALLSCSSCSRLFIPNSTLY